MSDSFLESPRGDTAFRALMLSPASAPRKTIRKRKAAADVAAPVAIGSLYDLWKASPKGKRPHKSPLAEDVPTYAAFLRRAGLRGDEVKRESARAVAEWALRRTAQYRALDAWEFRKERYARVWQCALDA